MLRVISLNLNGIRSAVRKGWIEWATAQSADVICVQEVRAVDGDLTTDMRCLPDPSGPLQGHFHLAQRKGYGGTGLYCRREPKAIVTGFGHQEFDDEGRYVEADFGDLSVVSVYVPSGSSSPERLQAKFRFMKEFRVHMESLMRRGKEVILCGDWNIAHQQSDLKNWRSNQKNSGFLPEERAWMTVLFDELKFVDVYRRLHPDTTDECYTWWSNRGRAWDNNVGWRLDYQIATPGIAQAARRAAIHKASRFSDHAPLTVDYEV